jgi:hypothetical protein
MARRQPAVCPFLLPVTANLHLTKPADPTALIAAVGELIRTASP